MSMWSVRLNTIVRSFEQRKIYLMKLFVSQLAHHANLDWLSIMKTLLVVLFVISCSCQIKEVWGLLVY